MTFILKIFLGFLGGAIGCFLASQAMLCIDVTDTTPSRLARFIGIIIFTVLSVCLASKLIVKKDKRTLSKITYGSGFMLVLVALLWATAL